MDAVGNVIDEGVLLPWAAPNSSTGLDLIEFIGHGSHAGLDLVLQRFIELGARPAKPGEFTRRAFIQGKISLDQAESISSFIDAKTGAAARASLRVMLGGLKSELQSIQHILEDNLALVELELDFTEEELHVFDRTSFIDIVSGIQKQVSQLIRHANASRFLREGIHIVIAGEANTGKSTLFNQWLGQDRAIVNEMPGTTRDYLDAALEWEGIPVRLVDTAGLRKSAETIEIEGIQRSQYLIEQADVLVWLIAPPNFALPDEALLTDERLILVRNKADLDSATPAYNEVDIPIEVSASTGKGVDKLRDHILANILHGASLENSLGLERRHGRHLNSLQNTLIQASELATDGASEELIAIELRRCLSEISSITGEAAGEDLLHRIFSRFCIGK
ncbi:tRNA modification GTPase MnmE [bacterium BMS3Bbin04]|nr:tRNA modification GTPase MnmE [bacterium BMS3Bbin04]